MPGGVTGSGDRFEEEIVALLRAHGYKVAKSRHPLGKNLAGKDYKRAHVVESPAGRLVLVSTHFQDNTGTTQEKIPWDVMSLGAVLQESRGRYASGYVVLGGKTGFTLKEYFTSGALQQHLVGCDSVIVLDQDTLRSLAAKGSL